MISVQVRIIGASKAEVERTFAALATAHNARFRPGTMHAGRASGEYIGYAQLEIGEPASDVTTLEKIAKKGRPA